MNPTGRPKTVTDSQYIDAVRTLYENGERLPAGGGVTRVSVADYVDVHEDTASQNLNRLADDGRLEQLLGLGPKGPQESYAPAGDRDA